MCFTEYLMLFLETDHFLFFVLVGRLKKSEISVNIKYYFCHKVRFSSVFFRWLLHLKQGLHLSERIGVAKVNHVVAAITPNLHLGISHSVMSRSFQFFSD